VKITVRQHLSLYSFRQSSKHCGELRSTSWVSLRRRTQYEASEVRYRVFNNFIANFKLSTSVKELWKSGSI